MLTCLRGPQGRLVIPIGSLSQNKEFTYLLTREPASHPNILNRSQVSKKKSICHGQLTMQSMVGSG